MSCSQQFEAFKNSIMNEPHNYHAISESLLRELQAQDTLSARHVHLLATELLGSQAPQHHLLFWYAIETLLVNNCSKYRTNKLAALSNLVYVESLTKLDLSKESDMLSCLILTAIHSASTKAGGLFVPEMLEAIYHLLRVIPSRQPTSYKSVDFDDCLQRLLGGEAFDKRLILKTALTTLETILQANSKATQIDIVKHKIKDQLSRLSVFNEPLLSKLINFIIAQQSRELEQTDIIEFRLLTPKFTLKKDATQTTSDLRKKRTKLQKRIANELRMRIQDRIQEQQVRDEARQQRISKRYKKELFIVEKQTADARKIHRKIKRAKQASKEASKSKKSK